MQKKIGIITMYYNSINYGGTLQAFALNKFLSMQGCASEQVRFVNQPSELQRVKALFTRGIRRAAVDVLRNAKWTVKKILFIREKTVSDFDKTVIERREVFSKFGEEFVSQSDVVYNAKTIRNANKEYDVFITGSDQVWNFSWYNPIYFLDFASRGKKKMSYAASISMKSLNKAQKRIVKKSLKNYSAISLREADAVDLLDGLTPIEPKVALDPALLLSRDDWNEVAAKESPSEEYMFCYFLGNNQKAKDMAREYAENHGLKLADVTTIRFLDVDGTERTEYGPREFLSYIRGAKCVFTDSFHAVVFSKIFEKQYFVFNRDERGSMSSRIRTITSLFETEERFCYGERENLGYVESLTDIDYAKPLLKFEEKKKESIEFLLGALEK